MPSPQRQPLLPGRDYVVEDGLWVFTREFLLRRGHCCKSGCRNCPYGFRKSAPDADSQDDADGSGPSGPGVG